MKDDACEKAADECRVELDKAMREQFGLSEAESSVVRQMASQLLEQMAGIYAATHGPDRAFQFTAALFFYSLKAVKAYAESAGFDVTKPIPESLMKRGA